MITITTTIRIQKRRAERSRPRVYFFHLGEDMRHNLVWRHHRPIQLYFELLPAILRHAGMIVREEEEGRPTVLGTWNQRAGCQCGCSPGIVLVRSGPHDLYVTIALSTVVIDAEDTSARPSVE